MSALVHAALHILRDADPQWVDHPHLSPSIISSADFSIATANNQPTNMDGVIYDVYPTTTTSATTTASSIALGALATGAAKATAVAASAASASGSAQAASSPSDDDDNGECRLLGSFALFVQLALGGLALMSLVYKRWRERPQRPVKIWFFDASKQVFGSVLVHVANVFMSMLTSGRFSIKVDPTAVSTTAAMLIKRATGDDGEYVPNPCSFYLLNLAIDVSSARSNTLAVNHTDCLYRQPWAFPSSSCFCESLRRWLLKHGSASPLSRFNLATMATHPTRGGG